MEKNGEIGGMDMEGLTNMKLGIERRMLPRSQSDWAVHLKEMDRRSIMRGRTMFLKESMKLYLVYSQLLLDLM